MTRGRALVLGAASVATAAAWLVLGTEPALPVGHEEASDWSGDFLSYYLPNAEYAGARLARGELPLWNPHQGLGGPFLAALQAGVLYPPNALHAVLSAQPAFVLLAALHVALAVWWAAALTAALGAGSLSSALAGLAWGTSLQVVVGIWSPPVLYTAAWVPALFLAVERIAAAPSARRVVFLALVWALMLVAGWPYTVAIATLGAALYGALRVGAQGVVERRLPVRAVAALGVGAALGAGLAAPQLMATAELLPQSTRAPGTLVERQAVFVDAPHDPAVFARGIRRRGFNDGVPGALALGLTPLALAVAGPGRRRLAALAAVGVLGLLVSFPNALPVYGWLRELPLLGDFRFPYRYRLLTTLALAVGAGLGAERLRGWIAGRRAARLAGAALIALWLLTATFPIWGSVLPFARSVPAARPLASELVDLGARAPRDRQRVYWTGRADRLRRPHDAWVVHDMEPLSLARVARLVTFFEVGRGLTVTTVAESRLSETPSGDYLAAPYYGRLALPPTPRRAAILDLLSVSTIVSPDPPRWLARRAVLVSPRGVSPVAFENPDALPRAYRVRSGLAEPKGLDAALARLVSPGFDPRRIALLAPLPEPLRLRPGAFAPASRGEVEIESYEAERVVLRTRGPHPAAVVLTDAYYPGWQARLDGAPADLLRANTAFRAVAVPAGEHEIELRYRPAALRRGFLAAAAATVGCVGLAVSGVPRRPA